MRCVRAKAAHTMRCVRAPKGPHKGNVTSLGLVRREKDYQFEQTLSDNSGKTMPEARAAENR